ncbi:MAG TPA: hypothetical protein VFE62_11925 [Gemmataceae bacterium]|nr:hypothetical protein [Gemmataceae bacterium]
MNPTPKRPGKVTFVGVTLIVLGVLPLLSNAVEVPGLVSASLSEPPAEGAKAEVGLLFDSSIHHTFASETSAYYPIKYAILMGTLLVCIAQIACGIGLLKLKPAARTWSLAVILTALVLSILGNVHFLTLIPSMQHVMTSRMVPAQQEGPQMPIDFIETVVAVVLYVFAGGMLVTQMAIYVTLFAVTSSASTSAAFDPAAAMPLPDDEGERVPQRSRYEGYDDTYGG